MTTSITTPNVRRWVLAIGSILIVGLLIASPFTWNDLYIQNVIILIMLLAIMASTWNIMGGFTGYISLGHSAYLGVGAYTTAILVVNLGLPWWAGIAASAVTSAALAGCFGLATRWARGHAFVMVTFAALELLKLVVMNLTEFTNGNHGIVMPFLRTSREMQQWPYYFGALALLIATVALVIGIRRSKFGAGLLSIREDEDKAASVGIPISRYKVIAFMLAGIPVGIAGGIYAYYIGFVEPRGMFTIAASMQIVLAVLLGGRGTIAGPLLGAVIVEPLSQVTTSLVGGVDGGAWRLIIFGTFLLAVILLLPQGIIPAVSSLVRRWRRRGATAPTGRRFDLEKRAPATEALAVLETSRYRRASNAPADILVVEGLRQRFGDRTHRTQRVRQDDGVQRDRREYHGGCRPGAPQRRVPRRPSALAAGVSRPRPHLSVDPVVPGAHGAREPRRTASRVPLGPTRRSRDVRAGAGSGGGRDLARRTGALPRPAGRRTVVRPTETGRAGSDPHSRSRAGHARRTRERHQPGGHRSDGRDDPRPPRCR
jgi:ABC-type branched-subunit amino acid transport system permease subunit